MIYELNSAEVEAYYIAQGTLPPGSKVISARIIDGKLDLLFTTPIPIQTIDLTIDLTPPAAPASPDPSP